jgi:Na+/melibiose symporter-like transporter
MQPELALMTISHTEIAIFLLTLLFVPLIWVRKELSGDASLRGVFQFGLVIIGLCTVVALMAAYFQAREMVRQHSISQRLDTTSVSQPAGATR